MKNPRIAKTLKQFRNLRKLSVRDVVALLEGQNISVAPKTVYGWENGGSQPDFDTLMVLCELYHIDNVAEAFGYRNVTEPSGTSTLENGAIVLSDREIRLVLSYRREVSMQDAVDRLLNI